jgi:hypothetical protein
VNSQQLVTEAGSIGELRELVDAHRVCAIVDSCTAPRAYSLMQLHRASGATSLYDGTPLENYILVAPYLIELDERSLILLLENVWSEPWGILLYSSASVAALAAHFRRLIRVRSIDNSEWLFRFYDPRVLRRYLPTCTAAECQVMFGDVGAFGMIDEEGSVSWLRRASSSAVKESHARAPQQFNSRVILRQAAGASNSSAGEKAMMLTIRDEQLSAFGSAPHARCPDVLKIRRRQSGGAAAGPQAHAMLIASSIGTPFVDPNCAAKAAAADNR